MLILITAVMVALVVSFLCSICESVLLSIGSADVEALASEGRRSARYLSEFKRHIDIPIAAILIVNTIAHTIGATVAGASYVDVFDERTLWIFSIVFTTAVLLFTEVVPKTLGVAHARSLAAPVAHTIHALTVALRPIVAMTAAVSRALRGAKDASITSAEEIRLLAAVARNEGVVGARAASIIEGATRLSQLRALDVLVPRQHVRLLSGRQTAGQVLDTIDRHGHSRFPFSPSGDLDDVSGVVLTRELLLQMQKSPDGIDWKAVLREPLIIPESRSLNSLLRTFKEEQHIMAIVVDEYGGIEGIVTVNDILKVLVGDIVDEGEQPAEDLWPQEDGSIHVRSTVKMRRLCEHLGIEWKKHEDVATLGGLVTTMLRRVPEEGDVLRWNDYRLEVLKATKKRAEIIRVSR